MRAQRCHFSGRPGALLYGSGSTGRLCRAWTSAGPAARCPEAMRNKPRASLFQAGDAVLRALIRPLILAIFEALVEQQKACLIPEQAIDAVFATAAEQEERRLVRVQMEPRDDQGGKPVDGLPHVRMATGQIYMIRR